MLYRNTCTLPFAHFDSTLRLQDSHAIYDKGGRNERVALPKRTVGFGLGSNDTVVLLCENPSRLILIDRFGAERVINNLGSPPRARLSLEIVEGDLVLLEEWQSDSSEIATIVVRLSTGDCQRISGQYVFASDDRAGDSILLFGETFERVKQGFAGASVLGKARYTNDPESQSMVVQMNDKRWQLQDSGCGSLGTAFFEVGNEAILVTRQKPLWGMKEPTVERYDHAGRVVQFAVPGGPAKPFACNEIADTIMETLRLWSKRRSGLP
ncbi:MAG: hypothetical protein K1X67_13135 [Fimbriimonadaceae bacterium]|nr:hypothetical protein [Fimbriimonadaceae bacterium]